MAAWASARYAIKVLYELRDTYQLRDTLPEPWDWADHLGNVYPTVRYGIAASMAAEIIDIVTLERFKNVPQDVVDWVKRTGIVVVGSCANVVSESGLYDKAFGAVTTHDPIDGAYGIAASVVMAFALYPPFREDTINSMQSVSFD